MPKSRLSLSIEEAVVSKIESFNEMVYPGLSQSAVVEILLRDALSRVIIPGEGLGGGLDVAIGEKKP